MYLSSYEREQCGPSINLKIDKWLNKRSGSGVFLWVHYFDLHLFAEQVEKSHNSSPWKDPKKINQTYNSFAKNLDESLNDLFKTLSEQLNMKKTMIVLSSDHGEMLGENDCFLHGSSVYESEMNVPLIIHYPDKFRKMEIYDNVRTIDIAPTVLDVAGFEVPSSFDGESLIPLIKNGKGKKRLCYMESSYTDKYAVRLGDYKFIYNGTNYIIMPKKIVRGNELYDLSKDPDELNNLIDKKGKISNKLKKVLFSLLKIEENGVTPSKILSDETVDELIKMGYLKK